MAHQVLLTIPNGIFNRARQLANRQARRVEDVLADAIMLDEAEDFIDWSEPDEALDREMEAYIAMHPQLKQTMMGKHVAIIGGKLVDHDDAFEPLYERILRDHPNQVMWLTEVGEEPIGTLNLPSFRLEPE